MAKTRTIVRYRSRPVSKGRRRSRGMTIPLAVIGGCLPLGLQMVRAGGMAMRGDPNAAFIGTIYSTGYDIQRRRFSGSHFAYSYVPIFAGAIAHKLANKLGFNAALSKAGVPLLRI